MKNSMGKILTVSSIPSRVMTYFIANGLQLQTYRCYLYRFPTLLSYLNDFDPRLLHEICDGQANSSVIALYQSSLFYDIVYYIFT